MDHLEPRLRQFLKGNIASYPLPWHNNDPEDPRPHVQTEDYARVLLDVLAGDDRRSDLRRMYRFFLLHDKPNDGLRQTARWMLIEALKQYWHIFPAYRVAVLMNSKTLKGPLPSKGGWRSRVRGH